MTPRPSPHRARLAAGAARRAAREPRGSGRRPSTDGARAPGFGRSSRVSHRSAALCAWASGALMTAAVLQAGPARAQWVMDPSRYMASSAETRVAIEAVEGDGPTYPISQLTVGFREAHPDLPPLDALLPVNVVLTPTETGYVAPRPGQPEERLTFGAETPVEGRFHASAIASIGQALLLRAHDAGLLGVFIMPSPSQIDPTSERDLRAAGDEALRLEIWIGRITDVRTVATGDRISGDWRIDNPKHRRILEGSPLFPADAGRDDTTDLLLDEVLESYVFQLNRHPGRQVEAALAPAEDSGGITLDYRVYEPKPWIAYFQSSNTGVDRTAVWQNRVGYQNRQLTSRDDVLSIEYLNAGLDDVNAVSVAYSAPWFSPVRPSWMRQSRRESKWIGWLNRNEVPWWGTDRLRWGVRGSWSRYKSNRVVEIDPSADSLVVTNDWKIGGELEYNVYQRRAFFLDMYGGVDLRGLDVVNESLLDPYEANGLIIEPEFGLRFDRINLYSALAGRFSVQGGFTNLDDESAQLGTGRPIVDSKWALLQWDLGWSHYLEPLLNPRGWRDPETHRSSTLAHEFALGTRGQYAFDYRLIPQASQVIGGMYSVRGFPNSLAPGDSVYVGSAEYRFHLPRALGLAPRPVHLPWIGDFRVAPQQVYGRPDWDFVIRGFVDAGQTIRNRRALNTAATEIDQTLVGAGVGAELILGGHLRARVDWGRGLYQNRSCVVSSAPQCNGPDDIDPKGELNFLFSLVY